MLCSEVAKFLSDNGLGRVGDDIGWSRSSDALIPQTTLYEMQGGTVGRTQNDPGVAREMPRLQVIAKAPSYDDARQRAEAAYQVLATVKNQTLSGVFYLSIVPQSPPYDLGRDANDQAMLAFSCTVDKRPSPATP